MANFTNFYRVATAAVGAILISAACVTAAVGPATTGTGASASYAAVQAPASAQANA